MSDPKMILDAWPLVLSLIFVLIWCIRLESKVLYLEKDLDRHKVESKEKSDTIWTKLDGMQVTLNQVLQMLGELKGKVEK